MKLLKFWLELDANCDKAEQTGLEIQQNLGHIVVSQDKEVTGQDNYWYILTICKSFSDIGNFDYKLTSILNSLFQDNLIKKPKKVASTNSLPLG